MKPIHLSTGIGILLWVAACSSTNITPVLVTPPPHTLLAPTHTQTATQISSATALGTVGSPTPAKEVMVATHTLEIMHEVAITGTQIVTITVVYDNNPFDPRLTSAWGFSALVEYRGYTLLFDTGGDGQTLRENMRLLNIDPSRLDAVVLSHAHDDHTGGLISLLNTGAKPAVYLPASFPSSFKRQVKQYTQVSEVSDGQSIADGIWTTGEIGGAIPEQALVIQTERGLVVITGCAHPGIVAIVKQAQDIFNEPILLVLGGFHLGDKGAAAIQMIVNNFEQMGVEQVAPCHCTGETAIAQFSTAYGDNFIRIGVGSTIYLEGNLIK